jgi:hypothetical protein
MRTTGSSHTSTSYRDIARWFDALEGSSEVKLAILAERTGLPSLTLIGSLMLHRAESWAYREFPKHRIPVFRLADLDPEDSDPEETDDD